MWVIMLDDNFNKQRARLVRNLATKADPFIKQRLFDLAKRYEMPAAARLLQLATLDGPDHANSDKSGRNTS
jgi:hypothetical protein